MRSSTNVTKGPTHSRTHTHTHSEMLHSSRGAFTLVGWLFSLIKTSRNTMSVCVCMYVCMHVCECARAHVHFYLIKLVSEPWCAPWQPCSPANSSPSALPLAASSEPWYRTSLPVNNPMCMSRESGRFSNEPEPPWSPLSSFLFGRRPHRRCDDSRSSASGSKFLKGKSKFVFLRTNFHGYIFCLIEEMIHSYIHISDNLPLLCEEIFLSMLNCKAFSRYSSFTAS